MQQHLIQMGKPVKVMRLVKEGVVDGNHILNKMKVFLNHRSILKDTGKRRCSRWDAQPEQDGETSEGNETSKRRKTRWASDVSRLKMLGPLQLPDFVKDFTESVSDPEITEVESRYPESLDVAVKMVEKLLIPIDEGTNDHKRAQLEELAKMNGTYRGGNVCSVCKEVGHKQYSCPRQQSIFKMAIACEKCGSFCHFTPSRPLIASPQVGNSLCTSSGLGVGSNPIPRIKAKHNREISNSNLYVGYLPQ
ncbi:hypothetical protein Acr_24g0015150 [Actinidia rufa]|uniref:Branchpoint-bridging protein n=1 Tax=Actinidia rufa TaxID=165716 RepID=A0A7J0GWV2_9ERIC|nr:hypothetical protein Acr_24g0015150 [Actinidia rufa]